MGKKQRRKRRKESSAGEFVPGFVVVTAILLYLNGVTFDTVISYLMMGAAILLMGWLVLRVIKPTEPVDLKTRQPTPKTTKPIRAEKRLRPTTCGESNTVPIKWTEERIAQLEWRVFEKLCTMLWQAKGFSVKETGPGADGGVDFYLYANATKQKIGAVQCKSWSKRQIDVKVMRELQGVVASEQLKLGLLMYSGKLSKAAEEFIVNPAVSIKAKGNNDILKEILKLDTEKQNQLLTEIFTEDHMVPSCPNCDVKLVERTAKKTGNVFWGCVNFPKCRFTMR